MEKKTVNNNGCGFLGLLTLLFIGLKLGGVIQWSWWWVLSPLWFSFSVSVILFFSVIVFLSIKEKNTKNILRKNKKYF